MSLAADAADLARGLHAAADSGGLAEGAARLAARKADDIAARAAAIEAAPVAPALRADIPRGANILSLRDGAAARALRRWRGLDGGDPA